MGRFGPAAADAVPTLTADLTAEDHELRVEAALAVCAHDLRPAGNRHARRDRLRSRDPAAFQACLALAEIGPEARTAIRGLIAALAGDDVDVRRAAGRALGAIGVDAAVAIVQRLADRDHPLDPAASSGGANALALVAAEVHKRPVARAYAAGLKPSFYRSVAAALGDQLAADDDDVSDHAARALAALGLPGVPALAEALTSSRIGPPGSGYCPG